jgi:membrane protein implicated in regulation of membrane protease activity|tara:strand:- start:180 stop:437 length:258 start_codon:yes stop_codon:yes gene_type:complete
MKKDAQQIAMYIAIGALLTVIILQLMGRLRTEQYESDETESELAALLGELEADEGEGEGKGEGEGEDSDEEMEPSPMGEDSDDEM